MLRHLVSLAFLASLPAALSAQDVVPPVKDQITAAVLPLPVELREGAGVLGYKTAGKLEVLRPAKNGMMCLGNDPAATNFHVACYHDSMEAFMARGRALRASGVKGDQVDTVRFAEVKAGKIKMPTQPASLYQLTGPKGDFDVATGTAPKSKALFVMYIPFATAEATGLSTKAPVGKPWIMFPGTPKAHIMISGSM